MTLILIIDLIVITGLVILALMRGPERALPFFAFVVVLTPWQSVIPLPGLFSLTTQRVALITLVALYLILPRTRRNDGMQTPLPLKYLIILSVVWFLLSSVNSVVPGTSFKIVLSEVVEYYLLYIILMRTISTKTTVHRILSAIVGALVVCSVVGLGEAHGLWIVGDWFPRIASRFGSGVMAGERGLRVQATFPHPIHYGAALAIGIPFGLYLISISKSLFRRVFLWAGVMLMFYNIYKTGSRGPWLALGLSLACLFLLCRGKLRRYTLAIVCLSLVVLAARSGVRRSLLNDYHATTNPYLPEGASYSYRYALLRVGQKALADDFTRSLWGFGPESFYYLDLRGPFLGRPNWPFQSCDSTWVEFMVETGYVGLGIMALLLITPAFILFRDYRKLGKPAGTLSAVLMVNLGAFYFMMISVAMYSWAQIGYLLWILIALSLAYSSLERQEHTAVARDSRVAFLPEFTGERRHPHGEWAPLREGDG